MPEVTNPEGPVQSVDDSSTDLMASKIESDISTPPEDIPQSQDPESVKKTDGQPEDNSNTEGPNVETGVDTASLPANLKERDAHWQRAFTKRTTEQADEIKKLKADVQSGGEVTRQVQAYLQDPDVLRLLKKKHPIQFQNIDVPGIPDDQDALETLDPASKKVLDSYMAPLRNQIKQQVDVSNVLYQELQFIRANQNGNGQDLNKHRDAITQKMREHPTLSVDDAVKLITYAEQQQLGANKKLDELKTKQDQRVMKPGVSSTHTVPAQSDMDMTTEQILQDEARKHGIA